MTDLVKELRDLAAFYRKRPTNSVNPNMAEMTAREAAVLVAVFERAATALDRPVDGEREELAKWCDAGAEGMPPLVYANFKRIASLLRTPPAEPSEAVVEAVARALYRADFGEIEGWEDADYRKAYDTEAAMPMSGAGFVGRWQKLARAALIAAGVTGRPGVEDFTDAQIDALYLGYWGHPITQGAGSVVKERAALRRGLAKLLEPSA